MANRDFWRRVFLSLGIALMCGTIGFGLTGCGDNTSSEDGFDLPIEVPTPFRSQRIETVSPPPLISELESWFETTNPQVSILSPKPDEVIQGTALPVKLRVKGLSIYKDAQLGLGPHLNLILDNQPYRSVYSVDEPFVLENLSPGTHTLRVFAAKPWQESFKNDEAYAELTFHVFTKTDENTIDPQQPLLTYSTPNGDYGSEPIMVDYYLIRAPLHMIAQESDLDDISDWQIRLTVNGEVQVLDTWQPIYIEGLQLGDNWVQLELIDENNQPIPNQFNNTARLVTYAPNRQDTLSKIVRGDLTLADVGGIVDPDYVPPVPPAPIEPEVPTESEVPIEPETSQKSAPTNLDVLTESESSASSDQRQPSASTLRSSKTQIPRTETLEPKQTESIETPVTSIQKREDRSDRLGQSKTSPLKSEDQALPSNADSDSSPRSDKPAANSGFDRTAPSSKLERNIVDQSAPQKNESAPKDETQGVSAEKSKSGSSESSPSESSSSESKEPDVESALTPSSSETSTEVQPSFSVQDKFSDFQSSFKETGRNLFNRFQQTLSPSSKSSIDEATEEKAIEDKVPASPALDASPNNSSDAVEKTEDAESAEGEKEDALSPTKSASEPKAVTESTSAETLLPDQDSTPTTDEIELPALAPSAAKQQSSSSSEEADERPTSLENNKKGRQRTGKDMLNRFDWYRRSRSDNRAVNQPNDVKEAEPTAETALESAIPLPTQPSDTDTTPPQPGFNNSSIDVMPIP